MKSEFLILYLVLVLGSFTALAQTFEVVVLDADQTRKLKTMIRENDRVRSHYDSIARLADQHLEDQPRPLNQLFFEGVLDTDPKRIDTRKSLEDVDKVINLIYAFYGNSSTVYGQKAKEIVSAWASTYQPTGNPINENKFVPFFWAYHLFKDQFSGKERKQIEDWMRMIAEKEMARKQTPNNNWEAKRLAVISTIGSILDDPSMKEYGVQGYKSYISTAYYADGTSNDLIERDALHYHISGLIPTLIIFISCSPMHPAFDLFEYTSPTGSSIRKSVEHVLPYATGEAERKEWANSKSPIDKKRAAAGIALYQPGKPFSPEEAVPLFEWAAFYEPSWYRLLGEGNAENNYTANWIGLLNSPLIRK